MELRVLAVNTGSDESGQATQGLVYNRWRSSIYQLDQSAALKAGFTIGSVELKASYKLLVIDVARTATVKDSEAHKQQIWGYGYRLLIEVDDAHAVGSLTMPAISAAVELNLVKASVRLEINGYRGDDMWGNLPVPRPLDIDTYKEYMTAAGRIQEAFEGHPDCAVGVLLEEGDLSQIADNGVNDTEVREAVVLTGLLRRMSGGIDRDRAISGMIAASDLQEGVVNALGENLYSLLGCDPAGRPSPEAVEQASAYLYPLDLD